LQLTGRRSVFLVLRPPTEIAVESKRQSVYNRPAPVTPDKEPKTGKSREKPMQKSFTISALLIASLIASCGFGSDPTLSSDQTERRSDGLVYEINSDTPYTGLIKDVYLSGQTQSEKDLVNGKPDGRMTRWYEYG